MSTRLHQHGPEPRRVDSLQLEALPTGRETRLLVELGRDALGQPMEVPVVVLRGKRDGPVMGLTAALHGNELNGIRVLHELLDRLDAKTLRGTIVAVLVANPPGLLREQRTFRDGRDLNHLMPGRADGNEAELWAHRLLERLISQLDYLIDLHTASFGRVNSLYIRADMTDPIAAKMSYLLRPQLILHNPPHDSTLRGAAMGQGIPSITVEIGDPHVFQEELIKRSITGLRAILGELGFVPRRSLAAGLEPILCARSRWLFTDMGGLLRVFPKLLQSVEAGEQVARQCDVFGDDVCEYVAPESGVVIGKSTNPVSPSGARILHLGIEATQEERANFLTRDVANTLRGGLS